MKSKELNPSLDLKPCPNCRAEKIWRCHGTIGKVWWCECSACHWCGESSKLRLIAEFKWNRMCNDHEKN